MSTPTTNRGNKLGKDAAAVLACVSRFPGGISTTGITGELDLQPANVSITLKNLRTQGYLSNIALHGQPGFWVLKDESKATQSLARTQAQNTGFCANPKSADRLAIEAALQQAGTQHQTAQQLASTTGLSPERVKSVLTNMTSKDKLHCLPALPGPDGVVNTNAPHRYALAAEMAKAEAAARAAQRETQRLAGPPLRNSTTAERNWCPPWLSSRTANHSTRPGAQDAFTLPSVVGGVRTPHKTPASMGTGAGNIAHGGVATRRFAA
jgi:hypothetical protein